jgi:hypothetical protein
VRYEDFRKLWDDVLRDSRLPGRGQGEETLDLRSMDRTYQVYVEPLGGQDQQPFYVTAKLWWRWDAALTARMRSTEEDLLTELLGRERSYEFKTDRPWLRVDLALCASTPYGKPLPMPNKAAWTKWVREAMGRLERIEPLIPEEDVREAKDGMLEILAWRGEPEIKVVCGAEGELKLESVELSAWQAIQLPRQWDNPDRKPDEDPGRQLQEMFARVRAALHAWMEVMDHLL